MGRYRTVKNTLRISIGFIFILIALMLSACTGESDSEQPDSPTDASTENGEEASSEEGDEGGTLNFAYNAQPPMLDPTGTTATATRDVVRNVFEQLVAFDSNFEVQPMLAESYELDEEDNTITFELRQGIMFHNGDEM